MSLLPSVEHVFFSSATVTTQNQAITLLWIENGVNFVIFSILLFYEWMWSTVGECRGNNELRTCSRHTVSLCAVPCWVCSCHCIQRGLLWSILCVSEGLWAPLVKWVRWNNQGERTTLDLLILMINSGSIILTLNGQDLVETQQHLCDLGEKLDYGLQDAPQILLLMTWRTPDSDRIKALWVNDWHAQWGVCCLAHLMLTSLLHVIILIHLSLKRCPCVLVSQ